MKKWLTALAIVSPLVVPSVALADNWPAKPVRWLVPYPAGGGSDFLARTIGQVWAEKIGQPVVVDNKPGGNTGIAAADVTRAAADGYTIMSADNGTLTFNPVLYQQLPYAPEKLAPITLMGRFPMILVVTPDLPVRNVQEFIAYAQKHQDKGGINYASAGAGSPHHLAMELMRTKLGLTMTHAPYRGAAPALADVAGGQVPAMMVDMAAGSAFLQGAKVRPLAVAHTQRLPQLPDVPTFAELGHAGIEAAALVGLATTQGTPQSVIDKINKTVVAAIKDPGVSQKLIEFGVEPVGNTTEEYNALLQAEAQRWRPLIKELGISLD